MTTQDDYWSAHDHHGARINAYLTLALDQRFDELRTIVTADFEALADKTRFDLVIGLVRALATITPPRRRGDDQPPRIIDIDDVCRRCPVGW